MPLAEVDAEGTVFIIIPIVIVLVVTVVDLSVILIVSMVFFLASIRFRFGRGVNCRWRSKYYRKKKGTEQILVSMLHVIFLPARDFHLGNLGMPRLSSGIPVEDVRYRTAAQTFQPHSRHPEFPEFDGARRDSLSGAPRTALGRLSFIA